jgi:hypothetical protein
MNDFSTKLSSIIWGFRCSRVLHIANKAKIFDILAKKPLNLNEICTAAKTKPDMTEKMLIACAALQLVQRAGDKWQNTDDAAKYLVSTSPFYQGDIIAHSDHVRKCLDDLEDQLFESPPAQDQTAQHRHFIMGMDNLAYAGRADFFLESIDLASRKNLLDVGSGPASYSIAACKKHPQLLATAFDLPETIEIAKEVIARENMQDRINTRPGSWDTDDFGTGFDAILFSNVLHGPTFATEMKLAKAHAAMQPGGLLCIQEFLLNENKTGPLISSLFNVMVGAYNGPELIRIITDAGFENAKIVASDDDLGSAWITATKI